MNTGEVKPASGSAFLASTMSLTTTGGVSETNGIITGGSTTDRVTAIDTPQFQASYTASAGYALSDAFTSTLFGSRQLSGDSTVANGNGVVFFTNIAGAVEDYLALYQQSTYSSNIKGSGYTTAKYGGTAGWQHTIVNGTTRATRLTYFGYGVPTPVASMPHSGVVRFSMLSSGNYATDTDLWFLSSVNGNVIDVDFATGRISGQLLLSGQNFFKSVVGGIGGFPLSGVVSGNSATSTFTNGSLGTSGGVSGQYRLLFVGPNADELVLTFVANDGTQAAVGAAVGVRDPNLN
ncbi:hypothetical protein GCM10011380_11900 [Sphingomonas metalli]|uniref:Transferrin-binding protein B C-lobe/N-lobe beta barrel domain-containing protein n=1 Tax=Sphingomonas metalli TaxID=1779358 RepID=A0A916SYP7_9SPHN|nr:hypothetical protein [Sphingomonas metalli]GGB23854.1 hypothetical protein GCM10011380_11900 [Sphingomonas metalli]